MNKNHLQRPVSDILRIVAPLTSEASLENAATRMHESGCSVLPIVSGSTIKGILTDVDLYQALADDIPPSTAVEKVLWRKANIIASTESCEIALEKLGKSEERVLVVVDEIGFVLGVASGADIFADITKELRPKMVGGMATPFGVYLTNGGIRAGVSSEGLFVLGSIIFLTFSFVGFLSVYVARNVVLPTFGLDVARYFVTPATIIGFLAIIRLSPIAGIHAAEHMVVHAIERGEKLHKSIVRRMPRVHPRCGTNLAVGISVFVGLSNAGWIKDPEMNLFFAILMTLIWWKPIGSFVQFFFTTKPPTDAQLEMGLKSGRELLRKYKKKPIFEPSFGRRLANSGMPEIFLGSFLTYFLLSGVFSLLNLPKLY